MSKLTGRGIAVDDVRRMKIISPIDGSVMQDKEGRQAFIDLASAHSEAARRTRQSLQSRRMNRFAVRMTAEEADAEAAEVFAAITKAWHLVDVLGEHVDLPCTRDNALELYQHPEWHYVRQQVEAFVHTAGNFLPGSSTT